MLDLKFIRANVDLVKENLKKKGQDDKFSLVDELLSEDEDYRALLKDGQELRKSRNTLSAEINKAKKEGGDVSAILQKAKELPNKIKEFDQKIDSVYGAILEKLRQIPNIMNPLVPIGKDDTENVEIKKVGDIKEFDFEIKNHVELIEALDLADFEAASKVSGKGFYYLKGDLALLNQALIRFATDVMIGKQYTYIEPPLVLHKKVLDAAMDTKDFDETIYKVEGEDLNLIGTSEHALLGLHMDEAIQEQNLPKKYFSYSMCFRKEIGSHGINEKGLWRTHQFNKVEQFIFCKPDESEKFYDELLGNSEEIFQKLELPYRVIECCSGDLATWKARSADIEVFRPTTKSYGEVTSLTNCTSYQAQGVNMKVVYKNGDREFLHTLNNTAIATSRTMVAIIENYQNADGTITIPEVLKPYMGGKDKISKT